jgi:hypothetical protein
VPAHDRCLRQCCKCGWLSGKPFEKTRSTLAEVHPRAAVHDVLATDCLRATDEMAVFGTYPYKRSSGLARGFPTATWKTRSAAPGNGGSLGGAVDDLIAEYLENEDAQRLFQLLVAADDPQLGPILFRLKDCRLPLPRQVLEGVGIE